MALLFSSPDSTHSSTQSKQFVFALVIAFVLALAPSQLQMVQAQDGGSTTHIVASGENLSSIARRYNVTVSQLMAHNSIRDANLIRPGQQILIPGVVLPPATPMPTVPSAEVPTSGSTQTVDTPSADNLSSPQGDELVAPPTATRVYAPGAGVEGYTVNGEPVYIVRRGDTLSGIAAQYGVTIQNIVRRNNLRSYNIFLSQRLIIPLYDIVPSTQVPPVIVTSSPTYPPVVRPTPRPQESVFKATPTPESPTLKSLFLLPTLAVTPTPRPLYR